MLILLIRGPKAPGNDIVVLTSIDDLIELWEVEVNTYDASKKEYFLMHATVMWTINDFSVYVNLSRWSTKVNGMSLYQGHLFF